MENIKLVKNDSSRLSNDSFNHSQISCLLSLKGGSKKMDAQTQVVANIPNTPVVNTTAQGFVASKPVAFVSNGKHRISVFMNAKGKSVVISKGLGKDGDKWKNAKINYFGTDIEILRDLLKQLEAKGY